MNLSGKSFLFIAGAVIIGGILASLSTRYISDKLTERKLAQAEAA